MRGRLSRLTDRPAWGYPLLHVQGQNGSIWLAAEYIPGGPRTLLANWGTFIGHVTP